MIKKKSSCVCLGIRVLFVLGLMGIVLTPSLIAFAAERRPPTRSRVRPLMIGDQIPNMTVKNGEGREINLKNLLLDHHTVLTFGSSERLTQPAAVQYFRELQPYLVKLGYQIVIVLSEAPTPTKKSLNPVDPEVILFDESREALVTMGLAESTKTDEKLTNALFLVGPDGMIRFQYASASLEIPLLGEVLVFAARAYHDHFLELKRIEKRKK